MKTINDLRKALFDTMEDVREGKTETDTAKAVVDLAQTIVNTVKVEIDFMRHSGETVDTGFISADVSSRKENEELPNGVVRVVRNRLL